MVRAAFSPAAAAVSIFENQVSLIGNISPIAERADRPPMLFRPKVQPSVSQLLYAVRFNRC